MKPRKLSIVVPVLNDAEALAVLLGQPGVGDHEVIVVDGGSSDGSAAVAAAAKARFVAAGGGRGPQIAQGVSAASGERILILHADSRFSAGTVEAVARAAGQWGRLTLRFDTPAVAMRVIAWFMHWRSRLTSICTGDQGIWVDAALLERVGGMPVQPLMEDIELSRRLKRVSRATVLPQVIETSARRWQRHGVVRTVLKMWWFRLQYFAGVPAEVLAERYARF